MEHPVRNKLQLLKFLESEVLGGKSRADLFAELKDKYPKQSELARLVGFVAAPAERTRYRFLNLMLTACLAFVGANMIVMLFQVSGNVPGTYYFLGLMMPLFVFFLAREVYRFRAYAFRLGTLLALARLFQLVGNLSQFAQGPVGGQSVGMFAELPVLVMVIGLSVFLPFKVFPHLGLFSPKRDDAGNYRF